LEEGVRTKQHKAHPEHRKLLKYVKLFVLSPVSRVQIHSTFAAIAKPTAIALGNFDGVHCGHQRAIELLLNHSDSLHPTVVTFDPHPQQFFSGQPRQLLTTVPEKAHCLESLGIEQLVLLPFNEHLVHLTPADFVTKILHQELAAQQIVIGADFRFGYQRAGDANMLIQLAAEYGIKTHILELEFDQDKRIGSSRVRAALLAGELREVDRLLGRSYSISGMVVPGQQLGRTLGFPTANIDYPPIKFLPRLGVYCVRVDTEQQQQLPAVMNIGKRPTVNGQSTSVEVHVLNWSGDLYGQQLTIYLDQFLRPEQKFAGLPELTNQIHADCMAAQKFYQSQNS
jgi:riboflavin kinase / FMN adenylyltransferase